MVALLLGAALLIAGCDDGNVVSGKQTVPFEADFFTELADRGPDAKCGAPPVLLVTQKGSGVATQLGRFSTETTFCMDYTDLQDDGQLTEGESLPFSDGVGWFAAANGDTLTAMISGEVVPSDHPDFDFEFASPFEFTGGTGRFEGASGSGTTNSFVDAEASRTEHRMSGTLTLPQGQ